MKPSRNETKVFNQKPTSNFFDTPSREEGEITFARRSKEGSIFMAFMHPIVLVTGLVVSIGLSAWIFTLKAPLTYIAFLPCIFACLFAALLAYVVLNDK